MTALLGFAGAADAQINPSDPFIRVHATTTGGLDGWLTVPLNQAALLPNGYEWVLANQPNPGPITITDTNTNAPIAAVSQLRAAAVTLPGGIQSVQLSFVTTNGVAPTVFSFFSPLVGFPVMFPATGRATASIGCTDSNSDGATMTFLNAGFAYLAEMNGFDGVGGAAPDFGLRLGGGGMGAPAGGSNSATDNGPAGFIPIGPAVSSMHTQYDFSLTPFDQASGSSNFFVAPAPGAAALLGLGGLVALRRRR